MSSRLIPLALAAVFACSGARPTEPAAEDHPMPPVADDHFALLVADRRVGVIYEYEPLLQALASAPAAPPSFELGPADVEQLVIGPAPSGRFDLVLAPAAAERWRAAHLPETAPFEVKLGARRLFAGVVYTPIGAAAIRTPVLHTNHAVAGRTALTIAAYLGQAVTTVGSGSPAALELARRIDDGALRAYFQRRGAVRELAGPPPFELGD